MTSAPVRDPASTDDAVRRPSDDAAAHLPLPRPRGPLSAALLAGLTAGPPTDDAHDRLAPVREAVANALSDTAGPQGGARPTDEQADEQDDEQDRGVLGDGDLQLALTVLYELHHRGVDGIDDAWEWEPALLAVRQALERPFEAAVRARAGQPTCDETDATGVARRLFELADADGGPSLARYVAKHADAEQAREFLVLRSIYQLMEADPHTWAVPRLHGTPKAALVEIQADEYGGGTPGRLHSELFAHTMRGAGLDDTYGRYLDVVPTPVLASLNTMSLFALHRRLRGAIVGHLAAYEITSSIPSRLYGDGFRRLGHDAGTTRYFDEHVEADSVHEQIAARDLAGRLVEQQPALLDDVLLGAAACLAIDGDVGVFALSRWKDGASALLVPLADTPV
ncbi:Iron-containing redox enzyme [Promicromonospora umidemergens]|uniref:Heme oxygenase-like protein n=1 Tax=Promicromonospora umidemergens TaxID=629679 RepID=A0ABP8XK52_9MICO|nr:iron-containing redox enzyme family protein [Promicromonospora umidemergens]MCP2282203.1 Iron-containing redox enzyme [Promicromonospora umidemergens]